jgi:DNA invertase Pin-like site-specific DNA recombinase
MHGLCRKEWHHHRHYIDRAISAKTDNRPEFQQMIKDSDKKLFDIVLVWKLDRFARNRYDSARYKTQLKKKKAPQGPFCRRDI